MTCALADAYFTIIQLIFNLQTPRLTSSFFAYYTCPYNTPARDGNEHHHSSPLLSLLVLSSAGSTCDESEPPVLSSRFLAPSFSLCFILMLPLHHRQLLHATPPPSTSTAYLSLAKLFTRRPAFPLVHFCPFKVMACLPPFPQGLQTSNSLHGLTTYASVAYV